MVQTPSDRLRTYWPPNRPPVEQPLAEPTAAETSPARDWFEWLATCMAEHPILTLATAGAAGLALGWLIKRR